MKQMDIVQIISTKNIEFLSGPAGMVANPSGNWSIAGFIKSKALVAKDRTVALVPIEDLRLVGSYSIDTFLEKLKNTGKKEDLLDTIAHVSEKFGRTLSEARKIVLEHHLPPKVKSELELERVIEYLKKHREDLSEYDD